MTVMDAALSRLRCPRIKCVRDCPMRWEEQVDQHSFLVHCAAHEAAEMIEGLEREARRWEQLAQQLGADRGGIWPTFMASATKEET